jgi:hypothetical protein
MLDNSPSDKLASQQVKDGPGREAWWKEEIKFEIERLKALLRDPLVSEEEKAIAQSQVANYREMSTTPTTVATQAPADSERLPWLQQMYLLADLREEVPQVTTAARPRRTTVRRGSPRGRIKPFNNKDLQKIRKPAHAAPPHHNRYSMR